MTVLKSIALPLRLINRLRVRRTVRKFFEKKVSDVDLTIERTQQHYLEALERCNDIAESQPLMNQLGHQLTELFNRRAHIQQLSLTAQITKLGIDMKPEHYAPQDENCKYRVLTDHGQNYARRMISSIRMERTKSWVAIFMPVLSAIIAILGLLVALRKGK